MNILHLSDTHGLHRQLQELPVADVIIHSGDFTLAGTEREAMDFMRWFCELPYGYKIFIAGNHDDSLFGSDIEGLPENCFYLNGNGVVIEGTRFFGVPMFVENDITGEYDRMLCNIPIDTDVLVTHQPPFGVFDESDGIHYGSKILQERMLALKLKAHFFGHIHGNTGVKRFGETVFSNAAIVNDNYTVIHQPHLIQL